MTSATNRLPPQVQTLLDKHRIPESSLSVYIREFSSATPLIATHTDRPRNPASVMKLIVSYASLELLGPAYRWETQFVLDGKLHGGVLDGNLIIRGSGDPFLSRENFWHALFTLRQRGLKHIRGDLLIDNRRFLPDSAQPGDFDKKPYHAYNVLPSALLLNFNAQQFHFVPQQSTVHIYADPPATNLRLVNRLRLGRGPCKNRHRNISFHVTHGTQETTVAFSGSYPKNCGSQQLYRSVMSHEQFFFGVFKALWEDMGGTISGGVDYSFSDNGQLYYRIHSRPLHEIVNYTNKYSNNVMARQLLLTLGAEQSEQSSSTAGGAATIKAWMRDIGIPAPELVIENGSGLSRRARVSASTVARLLEHARHSDYQPEFFASLSMNSIDGTAKKRLAGHLAPAAARIKTGLLNDVRSLAGYLKSANGRQYIIVMLHNHPGIQHTIGTRIQNEMLKWLYAR